MDKFNLLSNFNPDANFKSVRIGSDSPVLEVELNELQDISEHRYKTFISNYIGDGVVNRGVYTYKNNTLTVENEGAIINGNVIDITQLTLPNLLEGEKAYLVVWEETVDHTTRIKYKGNNQESRYVPNTMLDLRVNEETSRRIQVLYDLVKTPQDDKDSLYLGKVENGTFILECELRGYQGDTFVQNIRTTAQDTHVITLDRMYRTGCNSLMVFADGNLQVCGQDYLEINSKAIRFVECLRPNTDIIIVGTARPVSKNKPYSHGQDHVAGGNDPIDILDLADRENLLPQIVDRLQKREIDCGTFGDIYVSDDDEIYDGGYF